jgi:cyanophycinase
VKVLLAICFITLGAAPATAADMPYKYFRVGNVSDVHPATEAGFALIGGGKDLDEAFGWLCQRSGGGDFLIVRATGTDAYNAYVASQGHENSVATLIIPNRAAARDPFVAQKIHEAAAIFIAGGDQANYLNFWQGTPVQQELNDAIRRGVPVGGASAGLAVQGEFIYSAQHDKTDGPDLTSIAALADPWNDQVVIVRNFLNIPALKNTITDTHFSKRDRRGRSLVFLARILDAGTVTTINGIAVDEHTALLLDRGGKGRVVGTGAAYFLRASGKPAVCKKRTPLAFAGVAVKRLQAGDTFDVKHWQGGGTAYELSVDNGKITSTQAAGY